MIANSWIQLRKCCVVVVAAAIACGTSTPASGQRPRESQAPAKPAAPPATPPATPPTITKIFHLQNVAAKTVLPVLESLFENQPNVAVAADHRVNAIIMRGEKETLDEVEALLLKLDQIRSESPQVMTIPLGRDKSNGVVKALSEFDMAFVELAATADGALIVRGSAKDVASARELIQTIADSNGAKSRDVSIEILWLTEARIASAAEYQGPLAQQLSQRGFGALTLLSQLEVATVAGGKCEASGASVLGKVTSRIKTELAGEKIMLDMQLEAEYTVGEKKASDLMFSTTLTTPLDRWTVFGVAQRQTERPAEGASTRDLFLIRVKAHEPLQP